jgi:HD-like signal output (HDOD) protein
MEVMSMNHAEVGYIVARHWGLPERICRAIMYHHSPAQCDDTMGLAVHLSNLTAHALECAEQGRPTQIQPAPDVIRQLGVNNVDFHQLCHQCAQRFTQLRRLYGA